jgi:uncharacterized protein
MKDKNKMQKAEKRTFFHPSSFILHTLFLLLLLQVAVADEPSKHFSTVFIPMRDGTTLPTDIYSPSDQQDLLGAFKKKLPCVLIRSPAGRQSKTALSYTQLVDYGYAVAIQETRSSLDKTGQTLPYLSDAWGKQQDGYDTVEWLATSEFTNGQIGTAGISASGITEMLLAPTAPPSLKCQYISMAASDVYHHAICQGGQFLKEQVEGWLKMYAKDPSVISFVFTQMSDPSFWHALDASRLVGNVVVPILHYGGWYDIFLQGTIDSFVAIQNNGGEGAKGHQKLVIGPWTHRGNTHNPFGDFNLPKDSQNPPYDISLKRWFDFYLKNVNNGADRIPPVQYYVMGPFDGSPSKGNVWRYAAAWPVASVETPLYLTPEHTLSYKRSNYSRYVFSIARRFYRSQEAELPYAFDPKNPVPTEGGRNLFLPAGPKDQKDVEKRNDVLVFTSDPLPEDLEVTGRVMAKVYCSSDQAESDVVVRLCDVYPDGRSVLITEGIKHLKMTDPTQTQPVEVDLLSTSMVFAKGHSIRVSVSASSYPRYDIACNPPSNNKLHVGGKFPSQIILPIVK